MIPTDEKSGDRWLRNYPNTVIFSLMAGMVVVILLMLAFLFIKRPDTSAPSRQAAPATQPAQAPGTQPKPQ